MDNYTGVNEVQTLTAAEHLLVTKTPVYDVTRSSAAAK